MKQQGRKHNQFMCIIVQPDVHYWNHLGCKGRQQHQQAALLRGARWEPTGTAGQCPQWQGTQSHSAQTRGVEPVWWQQSVTYNMWLTQDQSLNGVPEPKNSGCMGRGPRWAPHSFFPQFSCFHRGLIQGYRDAPYLISPSAATVTGRSGHLEPVGELGTPTSTSIQAFP